LLGLTLADGDALGEALGLTDGLALGDFDGLTEADGESDGLTDGLTEGLLLGDTDGLMEAEGDNDGLAEGLTEGEADGETDGDTLGLREAEGDDTVTASPVFTTYHCDVPCFLYSRRYWAALGSPEVTSTNILIRVLTFLHLDIWVSSAANQSVPSEVSS